MYFPSTPLPSTLSLQRKDSRIHSTWNPKFNSKCGKQLYTKVHYTWSEEPENTLFFLWSQCSPCSKKGCHLTHVTSSNINRFSKSSQCSKKGCHLTHVTSSNINRFSKIFQSWKEISSKICVFPTTTLTMLPHYLWKIKILNLSQIRKKMQTKKCHMNQLSFHSHRKIKPRANFNKFTIFIASSINDRCSSS